MSAQPDAVSAAFFAAARSGRLLVPRCTECGSWIAPYSFRGAGWRYCPVCGGADQKWTAVSGDAVLVTWTVIPDRGGGPPTVTGVAELVEGPWLPCAIDGPVEELAAGLPLRIGFARVSDEDEPVPVGRVRRAAAG